MATQVTVSLVIRHDQNDVWLANCLRPAAKKDDQKSGLGEVFQPTHFK